MSNFTAGNSGINFWLYLCIQKAVGFSGGGDSLFLLKAVLDWAGDRPVLALVVDHRLQPDSARWTAEAVEAELGRLLGIRKVIWLPGIAGKDITDGHTDFYARFAGPGIVVAGRHGFKSTDRHAAGSGRRRSGLRRVLRGWLSAGVDGQQAQDDGRENESPALCLVVNARTDLRNERRGKEALQPPLGEPQ